MLRATLLLGRNALASAAGLRSYATAVSQSLVLREFGPPESALSLERQELPPLGDKQVLINLLAAPINPSDINTIQGVYPLRPALPGVPGHEGVGVVEAVGAKVRCCGLRQEEQGQQDQGQEQESGAGAAGERSYAVHSLTTQRRRRPLPAPAGDADAAGGPLRADRALAGDVAHARRLPGDLLV